MSKLRKIALITVLAISAGIPILFLACGNPEPTVTPTSVSTTGSTPTASAPEPTASSGTTGGIKDVPRERQLRLVWGGAGGVGSAGQYTDHEIWNPYAPGTIHQNGTGILHEPLAYYSAFNDTTYPWLAESWDYNDDFTQLTIKTREGVTWSDGVPFSAADVAFTIDNLREIGPLVRFGDQIVRDVESVELVDSNTVKVNFIGPRPKFFYFMTYKFDIGVYMVPQHVYEGKDWAEFTDFDIEKGWPLTTGPWRVVQTSPQQKIIDRADSWWAVDQGLVESLPQVERIIYVPNPGEQQTAQLLIRDEVDTSLGLRPANMVQTLRSNSKITTHTGDQSPYGYVDWWPISLFFNDSVPPYNNPDVRWAVSYYIDREQLIQVGWNGAGTPSDLPIPTYSPLQRYRDSLSDLLGGEYNTLEFNPQKGDEFLTRAGYTKNSDDKWADSEGRTLKCDIIGFGIFSDIGPVLAAQLDQMGLETSFATPPDAGDRQVTGDFTCAMRGHGGSVRDPYFTMVLYQTESELTPGADHQANFYKWSNTRFDQLTDQVGQTGIKDGDKLETLWREAMEIWLKELPDVQLVEWYHRIPMNTTYWKGWPTAENAYTNGAFWHLTFQLILNELEAVQ